MAWMVIWIIIFLFTLFIEYLTMNAVSIFFSLGAIVSFIFSLFKIDYVTQIWIFIFFSPIALLGLRPTFSQYMIKWTKYNENRKIIGKIGVALSNIGINEKGYIKINRFTYYVIANEKIEKGNTVIVSQVLDNQIIIKKPHRQ